MCDMACQFDKKQLNIVLYTLYTLYTLHQVRVVTTVKRLQVRRTIYYKTTLMLKKLVV